MIKKTCMDTGFLMACVPGASSLQYLMILAKAHQHIILKLYQLTENAMYSW